MGKIERCHWTWARREWMLTAGVWEENCYLMQGLLNKSSQLLLPQHGLPALAWGRGGSGALQPPTPAVRVAAPIPPSLKNLDLPMWREDWLTCSYASGAYTKLQAKFFLAGTCLPQCVTCSWTMNKWSHRNLQNNYSKTKLFKKKKKVPQEVHHMIINLNLQGKNVFTEMIEMISLNKVHSTCHVRRSAVTASLHLLNYY